MKNTADDHPDFFYTKEALQRANALCRQVWQLQVVRKINLGEENSDLMSINEPKLG